MKTSQTSSIRQLKTFPILIVLFAAAALFSIGFGAVWISPARILRALFGDLRGTTEANIIILTRLPRTCACLLAGAALAVSGSVIQLVLSNPLAAPNVIGVNSGAGMTVALFCAFFPGKYNLVPFAAFFGALGAVLLVLFISERAGSSKVALVLAGVAISSIFSAIIDAIVSFVPEKQTAVTPVSVSHRTAILCH